MRIIGLLVIVIGVAGTLAGLALATFRFVLDEPGRSIDLAFAFLFGASMVAGTVLFIGGAIRVEIRRLRNDISTGEQDGRSFQSKSDNKRRRPPQLSASAASRGSELGPPLAAQGYLDEFVPVRSIPRGK